MNIPAPALFAIVVLLAWPVAQIVAIKILGRSITRVVRDSVPREAWRERVWMHVAGVWLVAILGAVSFSLFSNSLSEALAWALLLALVYSTLTIVAILLDQRAHSAAQRASAE
jgi:biotin transporter BioY